MTLNGLHQKYDLTPVINAAGTYTPLGVSRSSEFVAQRTAQALRAFFERFRLQEVGIGRGMKPSKEAIVEERLGQDPVQWRREQDRKVAAAVALLNACPDLRATAQADPVGMPFQRVQVTFQRGAVAARRTAWVLKAGRPSSTSRWTDGC